MTVYLFNIKKGISVEAENQEEAEQKVREEVSGLHELELFEAREEGGESGQ